MTQLINQRTDFAVMYKVPEVLRRPALMKGETDVSLQREVSKTGPSQDFSWMADHERVIHPGFGFPSPVLNPLLGVSAAFMAAVCRLIGS